MFGWLFRKNKKTKKDQKKTGNKVIKEEIAKPTVLRPDLIDPTVVEPTVIAPTMVDEEEPKEQENKDKDVKTTAKEITSSDERSRPYHITVHPDGGWQIKRENAERATKLFDTQKEAIEYAEEIEKENGIGYIIHKTDGTVRKKSY